MNKLLEYIKERSSMSGCEPNKWECDKYLDCDACLKDKIAEHDAKVRADAIDECIKLVKDSIRSEDACTMGCIVSGLEQLKEQKNEVQVHR